MKRKSRFLIGFAAAAITFGTLMATMGPRHFHNFHSCNNGNEKNVKESTPKVTNPAP